MCIDPRNGHVKALVGGRDYKQEQVQPRYPGQASAGFVLQDIRAGHRARRGHAALVQGRLVVSRLHPDQTQAMGRVEQRGPRARDDHRSRAPPGPRSTRSSRASRGRSARRRSRETAKKMGIARQVPNYPSIALGDAERHAARDGVGIRHACDRRRPPRAGRHHSR